MLAKSDFAQKLLHDLRLRKERVAAAQNSTYSYSNSRDAFANPGQSYRGSRQIKTLESVKSKVGNFDRSSTSNRSFRIEESSGQIVPYGTGRVRNSEKIGDLSMALAFAIENGGKFTKMDTSSGNPVLTFLHQFGQRSMDARKMERRSSFNVSQYPSISHVHINEVSKGIQKLNQILKACSNGLNFDRSSIEVGKELLKGAMDLEESLRMLVNLQEASDQLIAPQRKNRIILLDEDEDEDVDDNNNVKKGDQKQLERPRFSFDKPIKKETTRNEIKQRLMALTYPDESPKQKEKQPPRMKNSVSHKRSASCTPDFKNYSTGTKAGSEKGRISNVIAKLMGLDELPQKEETKALKKVSVLKKPPDAESRSSQDAKFTLKAENIGSSRNRSSGRVQQQEEPSIVVKQHSKNIQENQVPGYQLKFQQKEQNPKNVTRRVENKKPVEKDDWQPKKPQTTELIEYKEDKIQIEKKETDRFSLRNEKKAFDKAEIHQVKKIKKSEGQDEKHQTGRKEQTLQVIKHKASQVSKPRSALKKKQTSLNQSILGAKNSTKSKTGSIKKNEKEVSSQEKAINLAATDRKGRHIKNHNAETCQKQDELKIRRVEILEDYQEIKLQKDDKTCSGGAEELIKTEAKEENVERRGSDEIIEEERISSEAPISKENHQDEAQLVPEVSVDQKLGEDIPMMSQAVKFNGQGGMAQEPLTETEKKLKESVIKCQLFLNTAEALFKLNIPISILHANEQNNQTPEIKLLLDCGYEIMKKKARRHELAVHPYATMSISYPKTRCLDDLIKQLCRDFETLKLYGGNGNWSDEHDAADYLHSMIRNDMQNGNPDVNSMWDFGWTEQIMFAFSEKDDVIRDVEKHLLNRLIDDITMDLLRISVSV